MGDSIGEIEDIKRSNKRRREQFEALNKSSSLEQGDEGMLGNNKVAYIPESKSRLRKIFNNTLRH